MLFDIGDLFQASVPKIPEGMNKYNMLDIVDERNPAPVDIENIPWFIRFHTSWCRISSIKCININKEILMSEAMIFFWMGVVPKIPNFHGLKWGRGDVGKRGYPIWFSIILHP